MIQPHLRARLSQVSFRIQAILPSDINFFFKMQNKKSKFVFFYQMFAEHCSYPDSAMLKVLNDIFNLSFVILLQSWPANGQQLIKYAWNFAESVCTLSCSKAFPHCLCFGPGPTTQTLRQQASCNSVDHWEVGCDQTEEEFLRDLYKKSITNKCFFLFFI